MEQCRHPDLRILTVGYVPPVSTHLLQSPVGERGHPHGPWPGLENGGAFSVGLRGSFSFFISLGRVQESPDPGGVMSQRLGEVEFCSWRWEVPAKFLGQPSASCNQFCSVRCFFNDSFLPSAPNAWASQVSITYDVCDRSRLILSGGV